MDAIALRMGPTLNRPREYSTRYARSWMRQRPRSLSRDGRVAAHGLAVVGELHALLDEEADPDGAPHPTVLAVVGTVAAEAEAVVRARWMERADEVRPRTAPVPVSAPSLTPRCCCSHA